MGKKLSAAKPGDFPDAFGFIARSPDLKVTNSTGPGFYKSDFPTDEQLNESKKTKPNLTALIRAVRDRSPDAPTPAPAPVTAEPVTAEPASTLGKALATKKVKAAEPTPDAEQKPAMRPRRTPMTTPKRRRREGPKSLISSDATTEKKGLLGQ